MDQHTGKNVQIVVLHKIVDHIHMEVGQQHHQQHVQQMEVDIKHVQHVIIDIPKH